MPVQINTPSVTSALQRALNFKGRFVPALDEIIVPVYVLQDPGPAAAIRTSVGAAVSGSGAASLWGFVELSNPSNSGVIAVVSGAAVNRDSSGVSINAIQPLVVNVRQGAYGGTEDEVQFRDSRVPGKPVCTVKFGQGTGSAPDGPIKLRLDLTGYEITAGSPDMRQPLAVLLPGWSVAVTHAVVDDVLKFVVNFNWLEIPEDVALGAGTPP